MNGTIYPVGGAQKGGASVAPNLLTNSQFLVNERLGRKYWFEGQFGDADFISDRWRLYGCEGGSGKGEEFYVINYTNEYYRMNSSEEYVGPGIKCVRGRCELEQRFLPGKVIQSGKTYSVFAMCKDGTIIDTGTVGSSADGKYDYCRIPVSAGQHIIWAAMYEGTYTKDNVPVYLPKNYAEEYLECSRYFYRVWDNIVFFHRADNWDSDMSQYIEDVRVDFPVPMVKTPTATGLDKFAKIGPYTEVEGAVSINLSLSDRGVYQLYLSMSLGDQDGYYMIISGPSADSYVATFDAEDF